MMQPSIDLLKQTACSRIAKQCLFYCIILFTSICHANELCAQLDTKSIQQIIDTDRIQYKIPGLYVSISCDATTIPRDFLSGTTTMNGTISVQQNHLFQVGSITKSFIAVILLQLEAESALSLNDPINKWLSPLPLAWKNITIKQLLNHTSGIYNDTDVMHDILKTTPNNDLETKQWTAQTLINLVATKPLYFEPGQGWHYSNTNYVVAGMIIESVTHQTVSHELEERIFKPLQLKNTYYAPTPLTPELSQRMTHGYSEAGYFPNEPKDITAISLSWADAAGSIISNSHDMAIWFRHLINGSLLPPQQMNELMTTVSTNGGLSFAAPETVYGLGIIHDLTSLGCESWWHSGSTLGYSAYMAWLKAENIVITVTLNHTSQQRDVYLITKDVANYISLQDEA